MSLIVCAEDAAAAQRDFETWLQGPPDAEHPVQVEIKRLGAAQFMEHLLTEAGHKQIDWLQIAQQVEPTLQSAEGDDLEQGYWADVNQLIRPEGLSADVESLQCDLPEEIRAGLNWSPDKQFFFLVTVLSPPGSPSGLNSENSPEGNANKSLPDELDPVVAALPELRDKEVATLVLARNSVVAAWLWRRFAKDTQFVTNDIEIDPWCGLMAMEANPAVPDGPK